MAAFDPTSTLRIKTVRWHESSSQVEEENLDLRFARLDPNKRYGEDNSYQPSEHRNPPQPIKVWMAYFNMIRTGLGAGVLAMPQAVSQVGVGFGAGLIILTGVTFIHTHKLLLQSLEEVARQLKTPRVNYRYGFKMALMRGPPCVHNIGERGPIIIGVFMILSQLGICTVFVIFTSDNLRDMADWTSSTTALWVLFIPYIILETSIIRLKQVSYISLFGFCMFVIAGCLSLISIFKDPHGDEVFYDEVHYGIEYILFSNGLILFNMSSVGVTLLMDKALSKPEVMRKSPCGIIATAIAVTVCASLLFGISGFWSYGAVEENMLRSMAFDEALSMIIFLLYFLGVAVGFPLQSCPGVNMIIEIIKYHDINFEPSPETLETISRIIRPLFVLASFTISYYIPFQGAFVAFVGNLCTSVLSLIAPALMDSCLRYPHDFGYKNWILYKNIFIILWGLISCIFGVVICTYIIYIRTLGEQYVN